MLTEFSLQFPKRFLSSTNAIWNGLQLNSPWSIGMVSHLIRTGHFNNYHEWVTYYYVSGSHRAALLKSSSPDIHFALDYLHPNIAKLYLAKEFTDYKEIQYNHGRSRSILAHRAALLQKASADTFSFQTAYDLVEYRILGETWNGVYLREKNVELALKQMFPQLSLVHTDGEEDYRYAIDYHVIIDGNNICALQVKPESYQSNKGYIARAKKSNKKKNDNFTKESGVPVFTILVSMNGQVVEDESFKSFVKKINQSDL